MVHILGLPEEILAIICDFCIPNDLEAFAELCKLTRRVASKALEAHLHSLKNSGKVWPVKLRPGGRHYNPFHPVANAIIDIWDEQADVQRRVLLAHGRPDWYASHDQLKTTKEILFENLQIISEYLEYLYQHYDRTAVESCDPCLGLQDTNSEYRSFQAATNLRLSTMKNLKTLEIRTQDAANGSYLQEAMARASLTASIALDPVGEAFNRIKRVTLISKSQLYYQDGHRPRYVGTPVDTGDETKLLKIICRLPALMDLRCFGLVNFQTINQLELGNRRILASIIVLKRSTLGSDLVISIIKATSKLRWFAYDYCPHQHIWRVHYPEAARFDQCEHSWKPAAIITALEHHAVSTLEVLDLSAEMSKVPNDKKRQKMSKDRKIDPRRYRINTLKGLPNLRIVCLNVSCLPISQHPMTLTGQETWENAEFGSIYRPLADSLPQSVERVHICGLLKSTETKEVFSDLIVNDQLSLPRLRFISCDHNLMLGKKYRRQLISLGVNIQVWIRDSKMKHIEASGHHPEMRLTSLWNYPIKIGNYVVNTKKEVEEEWDAEQTTLRAEEEKEAQEAADESHGRDEAGVEWDQGVSID